MNEEKMYFLVGENCFFNRFCDGSFKSKWNGLWKLTKKYLEYYAIKINNFWLPTVQKFIKEDIESISHFYEIENFNIEEKIFVPEREQALLVLLFIENKNEVEKKINLELETAVNIREWNENWHEREYEISYRNNYYIVKSQKGKLIFYSSEPGSFIGYHFYKAHYPSNEPQRCFVTKNFSLDISLKPKERKEIIFIFGCDLEIYEAELISKNWENLLKEKRNVYENILKENLFSSNFNYLNDLFKIAILNLKKNIVDFYGKRVFIAGYPWFTQVWGRDVCLTIYSCLIDKDAARNSLLLLGERIKEGVIPNLVLDNDVYYNSSDVTPLFVIAFRNYIFRTGEIFLIEDLKETLMKILDYYKRNKNELGFIYSPRNSTWMDTLEREGYCLEVQIFWYAALKCLVELFELVEEKEIVKSLEKLAKSLRKNIINYFKKESNFIDVLGKEEITINQIFIPIFEILPITKSFVKNLEENFSTDIGLLTFPKNSKEYKPSSYHKGATWTHLLALFSYLQFRAGRAEYALDNLKKIYYMSNSLALSSIPEVWNSETGELRVEKPIGNEESAFIQTWAAAAVIKAIDEGLLGLEYNAFSNLIKVSPVVEGNFVRRIRIGNDTVTLNIEFKDSSLKVNYESKLNKEYKIISLEEI
ncbi:MAG: amylo-alpha-1,6-glucosidase [Candidatus Aenigmatarchaeota archaeon]